MLPDLLEIVMAIKLWAIDRLLLLIISRRGQLMVRLNSARPRVVKGGTANSCSSVRYWGAERGGGGGGAQKFNRLLCAAVDAAALYSRVRSEARQYIYIYGVVQA